MSSQLLTIEHLPHIDIPLFLAVWHTLCAIISLALKISVSFGERRDNIVRLAAFFHFNLLGQSAVT